VAWHGNRYELLDGVLLVSPAPSFLHEIVVQRIRDELTAYLGKSARVFTVQIRPCTQLEPDLLVIPAGVRVTRKTTWSDVRDWWLAVEVSGRGARVYDRDAKQPANPRLGIREAWRADLRDCRIEVTRQRQDLSVGPAYGEKLSPLATLAGGLGSVMNGAAANLGVNAAVEFDTPSEC
jgi:Uma2 family endonuclease